MIVLYVVILIQIRRKEIMKKMISGAVMSLGVLLAGVSSASAAEHPYLKDSNGNPIDSYKKYYMEAYEFPGQRLAYENEAVKLGSGPGEKIGVYFPSADYPNTSPELVHLKTERTWGEDEEPGYSSPYWLVANPANNRVELGYGFNTNAKGYWTATKPSEDMDPDFVARNYYAFKSWYFDENNPNNKHHKFMSYRNSDGWLNVDQATMNSKTMWRFIPAQ
ncbi:hypothetical protein [Bacillus mycoides]|uniref:hypothetical protein n=1 Tax=Bacillus mycoides TaxID=1405 RepID=UPI00273C0A09|nr:hypothetical protein [Bacillus mycoides]